MFCPMLSWERGEGSALWRALLAATLTVIMMIMLKMIKMIMLMMETTVMVVNVDVDWNLLFFQSDVTIYVAI